MLLKHLWQYVQDYRGYRFFIHFTNDFAFLVTFRGKEHIAKYSLICEMIAHYHYAGILATSKSREYSGDHPRQCRISGKSVLSGIISVFPRSRTLRKETTWSEDVTHVYVCTKLVNGLSLVAKGSTTSEQREGG